jgi:hypothetical protein
MARSQDWVRVSTPSGHHSVPRAVFDRSTGWRELKQDALDGRGRPLAFKPREDVDDASPARKTAAKKTAAKKTPALRSDTAAATPTPTTPETPSGPSEEKSE